MIELLLNHRTVLLIGNKYDLTEEREISWDTAIEFADRCDMFYIETSAKTGFGIQLVLKIGVEIVLNKLKSEEFKDQIDRNLFVKYY